MKRERQTRFYVRWLMTGFGVQKATAISISLREAIFAEMNYKRKEVACEPIATTSKMKQCRVGLLVDPKAVSSVYNTDVWSVYTEDGYLQPTRSGLKTKECWAEGFTRPIFLGFVVKGAFGRRNEGFYNLKPLEQEAILETGLPIYSLIEKNGKARLRREVIK